MGRQQSFDLAPSGRLTLHVTLPDGEPAPGVVLMAAMKGGISGGGPLPATDGDGVLVVEGRPAGTYDAAITGYGGAQWHGTLRIPPPPEEEEVAIALQQPRSLSGRVTDHQGAPIPGVLVRPVDAMSGAVTTSSEGEFELQDLTSSRVTLEVVDERYESLRVAVDLDSVAQPVSLVLEDRSVAVRGRVDGEDVGGLTLEWHQETTGLVRTVTTGEGGDFDLGRLKPGRYRVMVLGRSKAPRPPGTVVLVSPDEVTQYGVLRADSGGSGGGEPRLAPRQAARFPAVSLA